MKNIKSQQGSAALWTIVAVVIVAAVAGYFYYSNTNSNSQNTQAISDPNALPMDQLSTTAAPSNQTQTPAATPTPTPVPTPKPAPAPTPTPTASTASNNLSCTVLLANSKTTPSSGAKLLDCSGGAYPNTTNLTVFDASQEGSYSSTVSQFQSEGYTCTAATTGFPASKCVNKGNQAEVVIFTTTDSKYAVTITELGLSGSLPAGTDTMLTNLAISTNSKI